jgi:hypothetical protein
LLWNFVRARFFPMSHLPRNERARSLWARTKFHLWPQRYWLASFHPRSATDAARLLVSDPCPFGALVRDRDEVSLTIEEGLWKRSRLRRRARAESGPFKAITFDLALEMDLVGYLAPATARLAIAAVSVVPQCAFTTDHILVHAEDAGKALRVLEELRRDCRRKVRRKGSRARAGRKRRAARA